MITLALATAALLVAAEGSSRPCVPVQGARLHRSLSAVAEHRALREKLAELSPAAPTMVMIFGDGGHLSDEEYSIIVVRQRDGTWHGTAVGRWRIAVEGARYTAMPRKTWQISQRHSKQLDDAVARRCAPYRAPKSAVEQFPPPIPAQAPERVDIIVEGREPITFFAGEPSGNFAALFRPPGNE